jgi:hypothetical protein
LPLLLGAACADDWRTADLQLDVTGAGLSDEDAVRVCVTGVTVHEEALGAGRVAVTGLPLEGELEIRVSAFSGDDEDRVSAIGGAAGRLSDEAPYASVPFEACAAGCEPCVVQGDGRVAEGEAARVLVLRFDGR